MEQNILKKRLLTIKTLNAMKMEKNFIALEKGYSRQPYLTYNIFFWIDKLEEELLELRKAVIINDITNIKEELADLSNVIDYAFEYISNITKEQLEKL